MATNDVLPLEAVSADGIVTDEATRGLEARYGLAVCPGWTGGTMVQTMVYAFVTSRIDYCNSILYGASSLLFTYAPCRVYLKGYFTH